MLPVEMKKEIIKFLPQYPRISKDIYEPYLFYKLNCDLPISTNEVLNYFKTRPSHVVFFYQDGFSFIIDYFNSFEGTFSYQRFRIVITPIHDDHGNHLNQKMTESFVLLKNIKKVIDGIYDNHRVEIDVKSTFKILSNRVECTRIHPDYVIEKVREIIEEHLSPTNIIDLFSFFKWIEKIMYLYYNDFAAYPDHYNNILFYNDDTPFNMNEIDDFVDLFEIYYNEIASYYN